MAVFGIICAAIALITPLFIDGKQLFDGQSRKIASFYEVSSPQELELFQPNTQEADNVVINFQNEWQVTCYLFIYSDDFDNLLCISKVIPAENIVAAFHGCNRTVLAVSATSTEAQVFLEGPVHAYVAIPGGKTCYLSELQAGKEVIVVDQSGLQRTAIVGRVKIESRPLILLEAKV
ncbi:hypothetical protein B296_00010268 [Ensete ventricosum]|uniref:Uncharacterized protein n=1 Tax=Ensete ventricosum TaxID=4639 RepID=A0A427AXL0_ENSVE|nr:hypothetical protein B296_00010268 [Ensete ventricosum]